MKLSNKTLSEIRTLKCTECIVNPKARGMCSNCLRRYYYWLDPQKEIEKVKKWNNEHKLERFLYRIGYYFDHADEVREKAKEAARLLYKSNPEINIASVKKYYKAHKEKVKAYHKAYYNIPENRAKATETKRQWRAKRKAGGFNVT